MKLNARKVSAALVVVLMIIAFYVAMNLMVGNGPRWFAIGLYWWVLTLKNGVDLTR